LRIESSFEVPAPVERVWAHLLDVERVVVCMPGAELTQKVDEENFKGKVTVKLGPVSLVWAGSVTMDEVDEAARKVVLKAKAMEQRGKGSANATVTSTLQHTDGVTIVTVVQDLNISGQAAQFGRGMLEEVTGKLTRQFADCLKVNMGAEEDSGPGAPRMEAKPIGGIRLGLSAIGARMRAFFKKLFGRR
jgi:uncharacterized protein